MRLLIISNMAHYRDKQGRIVGNGPPAREIDHLAALFDEVTHIACLHPKPAPPSALPYLSGHIDLVLVPPAGGPSLTSKFGIVSRLPSYMRRILRELSRADVVHVRCPANISMLAIVLLGMVSTPRKRWVKYAGNWQCDGSEPWSYRFQRWWLRRGLHRGIVTVNGQRAGDPPHVLDFVNPCLTEAELEAGAQLAAVKAYGAPVRLLFVGRAEEAKGAGRALDVLSELRGRGIDATLDVVGDGPMRQSLEEQATRDGYGPAVRFHGWIARTDLEPLYVNAHFLILPSRSEGWPKVLSEAMAYGAIPLAGAVGGIPQVLAMCGVGQALDPLDVEAFGAAIAARVGDASVWKDEANRCAVEAKRFSYSRYTLRLSEALRLDRGETSSTVAKVEARTIR